MYVIPALVTTASVVSVTVKPSVRCIAILYASLDDPPNETTVTMLVWANSFAIQNAPLLSNDIGTPPGSSTNWWL